MFSRAAAILLAFLALVVSASFAGAQPREGHGGGWGRDAPAGWGGRGGMGGFGGGYRAFGFSGGPGGGQRFGGERSGGEHFGGERFGGDRYGGEPPRGYRGWGEAPREGGWREPYDGARNGYPGRAGGYEAFPGRGSRGAPSPYAGRSYASPPVRGGSAPRLAGGGEGRAAFDGDWRAQQNEVRQAVREGRHIPLNQAIEAVRRRAPGRELDAGIEAGPDGRSVYRLRWAGQNGRRQDYLVDAGSGAIVGVLGGP